MNIFDIVTAGNLKAIYESQENRASTVLEAFFPIRRVRGLKFSFVKGLRNKPVALVSANYDTNVLYRDKIGVEKLSGNLPYFKEADKIDEELRQTLNSTKEEFLDVDIERILDNFNNLIESADVTAERLRAQLISTGTITISENGVDKQYDYGFSTSKQYKELETKWSASTADPLADIDKALADYYTLTGEEARYMIMDVTLLRKIRNNEKVLSWFAGLSTPNLYPTNELAKQYLESQFNVTIVLMDKSYLVARDFNGTPVKYYPEDRFTLTSTIDLGKTLCGTTPEEADLLSGSSLAESAVVTDKGVAITTWKLVDPVNVNVKVSESCIASCPNIDKLYIVKVL